MSETVQRAPMMKLLAVGILGVLLMLVVIVFGGGYVAYRVLNQQALPMPGPSPVAPLAQRIVSTMAGENIAHDACQFGCYFECLAKLAEGGELTQKQQVETLLEYTGRAGRKFTKGDYPNMPGILERELEAWSSDLGEITPADRASLVVKLREIAAAFHTLAD